MSITTFLSHRRRFSIARPLSAVTCRWRRTRRVVPPEHDQPTERGIPGLADHDGSISRQAEIERLLSRTRTPETAVSFLRGITALSAPRPA